MNLKGFTPLILILGIFIICLGVIISLFLFKKSSLFSNSEHQRSIQEQTKKIENVSQGIFRKEWKGVVWTRDGFIKIDSQGKIENGSVLPPGVSADYIYKNFTGISKNGEDIFKNAFQLLDNGEFIFIGSPEIESANKADTLYSWDINSTERSEPVFQAPTGQKIQRFVISPDKQRVALIAVTRREEELSEGLSFDLSNPDENLHKSLRAEYENRLQTLVAELGFVSIYKFQTAELVKKIEIRRDPIGYDGVLAWKGNYLYIFDSFKFRVFDTENFQMIYESETYGSGPIGDKTVITPDGTKFIVERDQVIYSLPDKKNLVKFESPTAVSYSAFSLDSKRLLLQKTNPLFAPYLEGVEKIGELNLADGKIKIIGSIESLIPGLKLDPSVEERSISLPFTVYNPTGDYIIFPVVTHSRFIDMYSLRIGEEVAKELGFKINNQSPLLRDYAFLGWFQE